LSRYVEPITRLSQSMEPTRDELIMSMLRYLSLRRGLTAAALAALAASSACTPTDRGSTTGAMAGEPRASMAPAPSVIVGGQPMLPSKTIVDNAVNSADHTTLVAAVSAAGLVDTLKGEGPFTVFAPVDSAFAALPPGTVDSLMKPENRAMLASVLTYHVVPGRLDAAALWKRVAEGGGTAELTTVNGEKLLIRANGPNNLVVEDEQGGTATISTYNVYQSNGVIHVIDDVLLPS
jgi:uncharacterized surface protein with fasciclin (FAS1) repeats